MPLSRLYKIDLVVRARICTLHSDTPISILKKYNSRLVGINLPSLVTVFYIASTYSATEPLNQPYFNLLFFYYLIDFLFNLL